MSKCKAVTEEQELILQLDLCGLQNPFICSSFDFWCEIFKNQHASTKVGTITFVAF